jgi:multiple sugar transport system permease protein
MLMRRSMLAKASRLFVIFFFMCVIAVPFLNMVSTALSSEQELFTKPGRMIWVPKPVRWDNFIRALTFKNTNFIRAFFNTMFLIVVNISTTVIVSSWVAFGFARIPFKGRRLLFLFMLSTMMIPYQVRLIPLYITFSRMHWVDTYMPLIIFGFFGSPFYIFLIRQFIKGIPQDLFDAATIDGCSSYRIFWTIAFPQLTPVITAIAVFIFIGQWKALMAPLIYIRSPELNTIALELNRFAHIVSIGHQSELPLTNLLIAASLLSMIPPTLIFVAGQKHFLKGLDISSGLKG